MRIANIRVAHHTGRHNDRATHPEPQRGLSRSNAQTIEAYVMDEKRRERAIARDKEIREKMKDVPLEGPHARPDLTDYDKTPGSGILPRPGEENTQPTG